MKRPIPDTNPAPHAPKRCNRLLVVEPNVLTQWSLTVYLERWFTIVTTDSLAEAEQALEEGPLAALVVSDEFSEAAAMRLAERAWSLNSKTVVVRTMAKAYDGEPTGDDFVNLEKPFELAILAKLLGVPEAEISAD